MALYVFMIQTLNRLDRRENHRQSSTNILLRNTKSSFLVWKPLNPDFAQPGEKPLCPIYS